jgi:hypothetical protein
MVCPGTLFHRRQRGIPMHSCENRSQIRALPSGRACRSDARISSTAANSGDPLGTSTVVCTPGVLVSRSPAFSATQSPPSKSFGAAPSVVRIHNRAFVKMPMQPVRSCQWCQGARRQGRGTVVAEVVAAAIAAPGVWTLREDGRGAAAVA